MRVRRWLERPEVAIPLAAFALSRAAVFLAAYLGAALIADRPDEPPYHLRGTTNLLVDVFGSRWDAGFYVSIAEEGYSLEGEPFPSVGFFPLLPLAMRAVAVLTGDVVPAGIFISNLALLLAGWVIFRLVELRAGTAVASRTVWYLLIFPTAFFGSAIYTESLFLFLTAGALYLARRGAWESAALLGFLAALTRLVGVVMAPVLLVEWLVQRRRDGPRDEVGAGAPGEVDGSGDSRDSHGPRDRPTVRAPWWGLLAPTAVLAGTGSYMAYLAWRFDDPLAFVRAADLWGRRPSSPGALLDGVLVDPGGGWWAALLAGALPVLNLFDLACLGLFLALGALLLRRRWWSEATFVLLGALVAASSGLLMSQSRYMWVLFPAFVPLAEAAERSAGRGGGSPREAGGEAGDRARRGEGWFDRSYTVVSLVLLVVLTVLFANGYWAG